MKKHTIFILSLLLILVSCGKTHTPKIFKNEREAHAYKGPVKSVHILRSRYVHNIDEWKEGKPRLRRFIRFDRRGKIIEKKRARRRKKILNTIKYTYAKNWKRIKTSVYNNKNKLIAYGLYKYNKQQRRIMSTWHKADGVLRRKITYTYPSDNKRKVTLYNKDDSIKLYVIRIKNDKGLRVASEWFNTENRMIRRNTYSYKFDKHGNWFKRITHREIIKNGKKTIVPRSVVTRKIIYYSK